MENCRVIMKNLLFGMEWSGCYYLALNCRVSKKNKEHYPEVVYEVNGDATDWKKIHWVKKFDMKGQSVEYYGRLTKPWIPTQKEINNVLKVANMVEPS